MNEKNETTEALVRSLRMLDARHRIIMGELKVRYEQRPKKCDGCGRAIPWYPARSYMLNDNGKPPPLNCDCWDWQA